jgi:hypothetical protein
LGFDWILLWIAFGIAFGLMLMILVVTGDLRQILSSILSYIYIPLSVLLSSFGNLLPCIASFFFAIKLQCENHWNAIAQPHPQLIGVKHEELVSAIVMESVRRSACILRFHRLTMRSGEIRRL